MFLDISKKPGDQNAVVTEEQLLEENEKLKEENARLRKCNAAALREALKEIRQYVRVWIGSEVIDRTMAERIVATCDAALAAPARNCDRFQTAEEAYATLALECCDNLHFDCRRQYSCANCIALWLFAPAEGGAE